MWNNVVELFRNYMGAGLIVAWFVVCMVYLFFREKDKGKRVLFLYVPFVLFLLFFNPLLMRVLYAFIGTEIYYRILWLMPVTIVIAYTIVKICISLKGKQQIGFLIGAVVMIMVSGSCIYQSPFFEKAQNPEHMPEAVIQICDRIQVEGREVMAVFPGELISFVRQYTPLVCMPYGRDILVEGWSADSEFYEAMEAEVLDVEKLAGFAKEYQCHYIIVEADKKKQGDFEDYGYTKLDEIEEYIIFQDTTLYLGY